MQTTLYEGRIRRIESNHKITVSVPDVVFDISCDFIEIVTNKTMDTNHPARDNNYITLAVTRNKFKVGDFVSLRLVKEENLT